MSQDTVQPGPPHVHCFVCGPENPRGMGLRWEERDDGGVRSEFVVLDAHQGPPGHLHGGAAAAVLDDGMVRAVWRAGHRALAANLGVDFRRPVPIGTRVQVEARVERVEGRKVYASGVLRLPDGSTAAEASGLFVHVPGFFERHPA